MILFLYFLVFILALVGVFAVALVGIVLYYLPKPRWIMECAEKLKFGAPANANRQNPVPASWIRFLESDRQNPAPAPHAER